MEDGRYEEAISILELLDGYKNSEDLVASCEISRIRIKYAQAKGLMSSEDYAAAAIKEAEELGGDTDAAKRVLKEANKIQPNKLIQNAIAQLESIELGEYYCKVWIPSDWEEKVYWIQEDLGVFSVRYSGLEWPDDLLFVIQVKPMVPTDFTDEDFRPSPQNSDWYGLIYAQCVGITDEAIIYAGYPVNPCGDNSSGAREYNEMLEQVPGIIRTVHIDPNGIESFWEYYYGENA